jgi:hypothetical protein
MEFARAHSSREGVPENGEIPDPRPVVLAVASGTEPLALRLTIGKRT